MAVRNQARRFNWLAAGRRWRKTTLGMAIAVEAALRGQKILWGAPTYDQVRIGWGEARHGASEVATFKQGVMTATFPSGGTIVYRSLDDPDNARGHTADGVIVDEAADVKEDAWYEVLRAMLIDTGGWGWFLFTPKGRNWVWREWLQAIDLENSARWQVPTLGVEVVGDQLLRKPHPLENPDIEFEEIEQIWRTVPDRTFRQEILAEFLEDTGGVFRGVGRAATAMPQAALNVNHRYVMGVDWGKHVDFTVIIVFDINEQAAVAIDRFNQIDYTIQASRLKVMYERFKPYNVLAEQNAMGEPIIDQLRRDGLPITPFQTTSASKEAIIDALALAFEQDAIKILDDEVLVAELQAYKRTRLPSGRFRYSAPEGMHDDCVIALALAWEAGRSVAFTEDWVPETKENIWQLPGRPRAITWRL